MSRYEDEVKVTPQALRVFSVALKRLADIQEKQAEAMEIAGVSDVSSKNLKTALSSLVNLGKFIGAATASFCDKINEEGVSELEGAVLQFRKYLKRGKEIIESSGKAEPRPNITPPKAPGSTFGEESQEDSGGKKKKRDKKGRGEGSGEAKEKKDAVE